MFPGLGQEDSKVNVNVPPYVVDAGVVADAATAAAAAAFGVRASVVCPAEILADRALFVLDVDNEAHARRQEMGVGPEADGRLLAMWEWPESSGIAPPRTVRVQAILVRTGRWRAGLRRTRRWGAFAPAGLIAPPLPPDEAEECALECQLRDVGLVTGDDADVELRVALPPVRWSPGARRTTDRWVEEALYQQLLNQRFLA